IICGATDSLSPFMIVEKLDTTPPVITGVQNPMVAYASSTAGAKVTYSALTAVDDRDGTVPIMCTPASGTTFAPGQTTVTCSASDKAGNVAPTAFTVWVQYQAPADGTFFLQPINPDGSSIFKGSTIPVKFKLTGASASIADLTARLVLSKVSSGVT